MDKPAERMAETSPSLLLAQARTTANHMEGERGMGERQGDGQ